MNKIEVMVLNPGAVVSAEKMAAACARLTQNGHTIHSAEDFQALYNKTASERFIRSLAELPHPTLQKFSVINVVVVGASRRFLAQITRHQNEVKFMSASLQYSDYSGSMDFVVPYDLIDKPKQKEIYKITCRLLMGLYEDLVKEGVNNDAAGYLTPQGLRNVLVISATPYQWKHMISQRVCRRNTAETRYVMLRVWEALKALSPGLFSNCGPFCMNGPCEEGKMSCGEVIPSDLSPTEIIAQDFPLLERSTDEDQAD